MKCVLLEVQYSKTLLKKMSKDWVKFWAGLSIENREASAYDTGTGRGDCEERNYIHVIKIGMGQRISVPFIGFMQF